ncbi:MAG: MFS transporter [Candidatus Nanopelagicales bacterium]|nr:MFS transporter [Candidatus Nanopelagicales bacterium]
MSKFAGALRRTPWLAGLPREVSVLAAIAFCVALGFGIVAPAIPVFAKTFGVTAFLAGAVVSVFAFMRLITAPGAGALVNRIGERAVLSAGLLVVAVSSLLAGFANTYTQLLLLRGVGGIGSAAFTVSAMALLLRTAGPEQRGRAAGAFQAGFLFGGIAGPAVGGLVVGISIRAPFFVYAATLLLATAVALLFLRSPAQIAAADVARGDTDTAEAIDPVAARAAELAPDDVVAVGAPNNETPNNQAPAAHPTTLGRALRNGGYRAALVVNLSNGFVSFGIRTSLVPLFVVESLGRGPGLAGVGFLVAALTQGIALLPAGRLADHRGRRPAMIIGTLTSAIGLVALTLAGEPALFLVSMAIVGIGTAFLGSAPAAVVGDVIGPNRGGIVVATFQMIADVGSIAGPLLAGLIADQAGYHWAFATALAVMAVALLFAVLMPETKARDEQLSAASPN